MDKAFIRFGHGYTENLSPGRGPCTAFDGFKVIAAPLGEWSDADRESRVWKKPEALWGVTYGSHAIKLAELDDGYASTRGLYILGWHGGGREVLAMATGPDWQAVRDALLALPERTLYAALYSIWQTASNARREAQSETAGKWAQACADKRIRKVRGRNRVEIVEPWEAEMKARKRAAAGA